MSQDIVSDLKYKDWIPYIHSVNEDLNIINASLAKCYDLGKGYTKNAAINLQIFYMARETYIKLPEVIKKINHIVEQFHNPQFIKDYSAKKPSALAFEFQAIQTLLYCLSKITERLSENTLIPEVEYKKKKQIDEDLKGVAI
jgi:hypothetical protein